MDVSFYEIFDEIITDLLRPDNLASAVTFLEESRMGARLKTIDWGEATRAKVIGNESSVRAKIKPNMAVCWPSVEGFREYNNIVDDRVSSVKEYSLGVVSPSAYESEYVELNTL